VSQPSWPPGDDPVSGAVDPNPPAGWAGPYPPPAGYGYGGYPAASYPAASYPPVSYPAPGYPGGYGPAPGYPAAPPVGYGYGYGYATFTAPPRSVRGLGLATQILLGVSGLFVLWLIWALIHQRSLVEQIGRDPGSVSYSSAHAADSLVRGLGDTAVVLLLITGVVFIWWFYRARVNTNSWGALGERLSTGWAIGCWVCPVVSLWFPYRMMRDVFVDTDSYRGLGRRPVVAWWWAVYLLGTVFGLIVRVTRSDPNTVMVDALANHIMLEIIGQVVTIIAAALAIVVVRSLTEAQTRRISQPVAPAPTSGWPGYR
jgi:hypothetical protein